MHVFLIFGVLLSFFSSPSGASELPWIFQKDSHTPGPNCWNAALVQAGVLNTHRSVVPNEFKYLLQKNCQRIAEPQEGSVGRMFDNEKEVHSFVWVNPATVYAKHSDGTFDNYGYEFMSMEKMLTSYLYKKECATNPEGKNCKRSIEYYQCEAPKGELASQMEVLQKAENLIHALAFSPETKMNFGDDCRSPGFAQRNAILAQLLDELENIATKKVMDRSYLQFWFESVRYQVGESSKNLSAFRCKGVSQQEKFEWYNRVSAWFDRQQLALFFASSN